MSQPTVYTKAMLLANKLSQLNPLSSTGLTAREWRSDHFKAAYAALSAYGERALLIEGVSVKGVATRRIVVPWHAHNVPSGKGKPTPADTTLFTDLAKLLAGSARHTCSFKVGRYRILG